MNNPTAGAARRLPIGAEPTAEGTRFRVWAPDCDRVSVIFDSERELPMEREAGGYFSAVSKDASAGSLYRFRLGDDDTPYPDPASRFQPVGPHGPSEVIDPGAYRWRDGDWPGVSLKGQVIYELHIGTFTPEGTWAAAAARIEELADLGVTLIEMMPVADFGGKFGWGYDGVNMFAPTRLYGRPDDLRLFIDTAHSLGMGVILDVVYNHFGPDGNYLGKFAKDYLTSSYDNEWGDAINFHGDNSAPVREFFLANTRYWIEEFHFDGLRLDATQAMRDSAETHILREIGIEARKAGGSRSVLVVAENEHQEAVLVRPIESGGYGLDALWNDDFHHSAIVAMAGRRRAYYSDHLGAPQEFVSAAKYGFLFQGQMYAWQEVRRGFPSLDLDPAQFVNFVENHDQVANSGHGRRFQQRTTGGRARAMTAVTLLSPATPMLFQGQEYWSSAPFLYFADHEGDLARAVDEGRTTFLSQFSNLADHEMAELLAKPSDPETFRVSILDWEERARNKQVVALHRDLLRLRRETSAFRRQAPRGVDGLVLGPEGFGLRFFDDAGDDRLLLVNLGSDLNLVSIADPLVAPPFAHVWGLEWSSEHPTYGGGGTAPVEHRGGWTVPGHAAVVLRPVPVDQAPPMPDASRNPYLGDAGPMR